MTDPRCIKAANPGPFTLDGTRTYLVGRRRVALIDPGPDLAEHVGAVAAAVERAESVTILLTHGHHDHAGAVDRLLARVGDARVVGSGHPAAQAPDAGGVLTDRGRVTAIPTPGHARDHLCFFWVERRALFAGDHLVGVGDTTWVAGYAGCVADYLASLERIRRLDPAVIYPTHGPPLTAPRDALDRFEAHRRDRIERVRRARGIVGDSLDDIFERVYGDTVPPGLEGAARRSLAALLEYVDREGAGGVSSPA